MHPGALTGRSVYKKPWNCAKQHVTKMLDWSTDILSRSQQLMVMSVSARLSSRTIALRRERDTGLSGKGGILMTFCRGREQGGYMQTSLRAERSLERRIMHLRNDNRRLTEQLGSNGCNDKKRK